MAVWQCIDFEGMSSSRRMGIYDELTSKIKSAATSNGIPAMLCRLQGKFGVRSLKNTNALAIAYGDDGPEILEVLRNEAPLIVLMLREAQEKKKRGESFLDQMSKS